MRSAERIAFDEEREISPDDLLRGVLQDVASSAAECLRNLGMDVSSYTAPATDPVPNGEQRPRFTTESRQVLEGILRAAVRVGHDYLSSAHILVALFETQPHIRADLEAHGITSSGLDLEVMRVCQNLVMGWDDSPWVSFRLFYL